MPNLAKILIFYTKYLRLSSKCSQCRSKAFQNEIKILNLNFDTFKEFVIWKKLSVNFGKTEKSDDQIPRYGKVLICDGLIDNIELFFPLRMYDHLSIKLLKIFPHII